LLAEAAPYPPHARTSDGQTLDFCYDRFGRVTQDGELAYGYDDNSNRTTIGYPGNWS